MKIMKNKLKIVLLFISFLCIDLFIGLMAILLAIYHIPTAADGLARLSQLQILYFAFILGFQAIFGVVILIIYILIVFFFIKTVIFFVLDAIELIEAKPATKENLITDTVLRKQFTIDFFELVLPYTKKISKLYCVFMVIDIIPKIFNMLEPLLFYGLRALNDLESFEINFLNYVIVILSCLFGISYLDLLIQKQKIDLKILESI